MRNNGPNILTTVVMPLAVVRLVRLTIVRMSIGQGNVRVHLLYGREKLPLNDAAYRLTVLESADVTALGNGTPPQTPSPESRL